ncbi:MAG: response regulator [Terriglobia bacterium]
MASVLAVVDDLFFVSKLQGTARQVGAELTTVRAADFRLEGVRQQKPALVVFDLNTTSGNAVELIRQLKADGELGQIPVLGFFSHVQVDLQRAAEQAGCEQVLPRSKFTATLPALLQQFAPASD